MHRGCAATPRAHPPTLPQGVEGFDLHGGAYAHDGAWNRALRYECHHGETHCNLLALSLQLTDTAAGDGGFVIVPGSHKANFPLPPSIQALKKHEHVLAQPALEAGDVLLFSEATTHGAVPWKVVSPGARPSPSPPPSDDPRAQSTTALL